MDEPQPTERARRRFLPTRRMVLIGLASLAGLLLLGAAGMSYASYRYGQEYEDRILPGATIAGIDVSGMDRDDAIEAVKDSIRPQLDRAITISYEDRTWEVTPRELGAKSNARMAVLAALDTSGDADFLDLVRMRMLGHELGFNREVAISYPKQGVRGFVQGLASSLDREPRDQAIDYSSGWIEFVKPLEGRKVKQRANREALRVALASGEDSMELEVATVEPETTDQYDKVLLVRIGENKLYLYENGKIKREWIVATGLPEYATPTGEFEVELKRYLPTWVNPAPDTWGADLPDSIPPGPGNPLGVRAINWTSPAIRFHGTSAIYSLGYNASHGCVRMSNTDVIELYDLIEIGTPIISVEVAPYRPLYGSSTIVDQETDAETDASNSGDKQDDKQDDNKGDG